MSTVLVIGATGGIGKQALLQLLERPNVQSVRALVRTPSKLPQESIKHPKLTVLVMESIDKVSITDMASHISGCHAVLLCLGHTMSFAGIFFSGLVVLNANKLIVSAIESLKQKTKFIQVNTIGVSSPDGKDDKQRTLGSNAMIGVLSGVLPPFRGSRKSAEYLFALKSDFVEWSVVRPDGLVDKPLAEYKVLDTLPWSIFAPLTTNRASVAHFMCELALNEDTWQTWKGKFPIVLNA